MAILILKTPADIGALIKDRRRTLGLGQAELAERLGASRLWVNQVERGKRGASLGMVLRALAVLGLTLSSDMIGRPALLKQSKRSASTTGIDIDAVITRARTPTRSKAKK